MNRNNERHFLNVPQMHTSRTRFNRDQTILTTFDSGKLIPFFVDEVLPGDTFQVDTSAIIRMTTPKYPVMDDAFIDFYYFYCPNRILWKNFKAFMGEADQVPWTPTREYAVPSIRIPGTENKPAPLENSILDYMGIPTKIKGEFSVNALPVRAYVRIWNEYFKDENVDLWAQWKDDDGNQTYTDYGDNSTLSTATYWALSGGRCLPVNKFHDYFTSCLPYPQRGPEVTMPLSGNAPVGMYKNTALTQFGTVGGHTEIYLNQTLSGSALAPNISNSQNEYYKGFGLVAGSSDPTDQVDDTAYLGADLSRVTAATINDLRKAVAVQQYYEALARGGSRYREQVQALWNVTISDKTAQIPEYLGGGRYHVNMNQIIQTSSQQSATDTPIGETGAVSVTPVNESSFTKSFEEHGFVIGVMCVRHNRSYQQGLERFWSRRDRLDYYVPQFANLGEQPVKKKEIMLTATDEDDETFGYQEAWADYRMKPNRVSGLMRSNATGTLDFWHYADNYEKVPTLSMDWMKEGKAEIARTLIEQNEPQFFGAIRIANKTTRCMPLYSVPGLEKL
jgi:hypothetical protein